MRKVVAAINLTIDGFCDHTAGIADEEIHDHYTALLNNSDVILYGRTTYELMQFWQTLLEKPSGEQSMDDFAKVIDRIPKIIFSTTLKDTGWATATLADEPLKETVLKLKQQSGGDILIGCRSLIDALANLNLIDEYQLCIHPVIIGKGLPLFDQINERTVFKLLKTKIFGAGATLLYYQRA
ncbi:dihydrofolate reductase family protein [Imperialibacter roseus]|uniref:Dihydrofolate reductase family protein n=1 Tax=Imperialibacter roseus TaxID=1324217 RepID=A0ABZ0IU27_9BACT|nr:dihydrofolate reductase family protein [Imperialibacter roseus]WOK08111.1 dihydrofolate reductase family protein [Imperialibacter roseus]